MVTHRDGHFGNAEPTAVQSASTDVERASVFIRRLEGLAADQRSRALGRAVSLAEVRPSLARRLRTTVGTLANFRKGRKKTVPGWLEKNIVNALVGVLQSEVRALELEIETCRRLGLDHHNPAVGRAISAIGEARAALCEAKQSLVAGQL